MGIGADKVSDKVSDKVNCPSPCHLPEEGEPAVVLGLIQVSGQFHGRIRSCGGSRKSEAATKVSTRVATKVSFFLGFGASSN
jgi:hypothetical protein